MPSMAHEVLVDLFKNRPSLGPELLTEALGVALPTYTERARFYGDLVLNSLNGASRRALEAMMKGYEYQSDFAKKYVAQGRAEEAARAVLTALRVRGLPAPDAARERILAEK